MDLRKLLGFPFKGGQAIGEAFPGLEEGLRGLSASQRAKANNKPLPEPARHMPPMVAKQFQPLEKLPYLAANGQPIAPSTAAGQRFRETPHGWEPVMSVQPAAAPRPGASWNGLQQSTSFDGNLQGYNQDDLSQGIQGGMVNQGSVRLQGPQRGSGGFTNNLQSADPLSALRKLLGF